MEDLIYMHAVKNIMKKRYIASVELYSKIIDITMMKEFGLEVQNI